MSEQTSWWLAAQQASYSEFYGYARKQYERMSAVSGPVYLSTWQAMMARASAGANITLPKDAA